MPSNSRTEAAGGSSPSPGPRSSADGWGVALAAIGILLSALAAYRNSFGGPFILDDPLAITGNPTIKHLGSALFPPHGSPVSGRPLLNLTFALNYALGGYRVWGYHALDLVIHAMAALTLFGIVRRSLERPALGGLSGWDALLPAFLAAVLWTVHPLQTEAVTYVSERAESLMAFFYLQVLYLFVRGADSGRPTPWLAASVLSCLLGALTKEIIATAPLLVLLYDRIFCSGSFREAWRMRWRYYAGLAAAWPLLALLMAGSGERSVGFGHGISPWEYALTSARSVVLYLKLAVWPHPLVLDYGTQILRHPAEAAPFAIVLALFLAFAALSFRRWPAIGFACAWFLLVLAPTSSFVPVGGQPMAEHRMYLPLAAIVAAVVLGLWRLAGRGSLVLLLAAAAGLGWMSFQRNKDYRSAQAIWSDTVAKVPGSARAHAYYGLALSDVPGCLPQAISEYEAALRIDPGMGEVHNNLGDALAHTPGRSRESIAQFEEAIRIDPANVVAHYDLGVALAGVPGRLQEALSQFDAALRINPGFAPAHNNKGIALAGIPGRLPEAMAEYETALRIDPDFAEAHNDRGAALAGVPGRELDAIADYRAAIRIKPDYPEAHENLGIALAALPGRMPEAISEYEAAIRIRPDDPAAHNKLGIALADTPGRLDEAIAHFRDAIRIDPNFFAAHDNLALALSKVPGRMAEAISEYETALRIKPDDAEGHNNLGIALASFPARLPEAVAQFEEALRIRPDYAAARDNLDLARQMLGRTQEDRKP
jgi:protein O-mannosyl-transferase